MAITTRGVYFYNSSQQIIKQGSLSYDSGSGKYTYSSTPASIQQGDVGVTQLVCALPLGTFTGGYPLSIIRRKDGWTSAFLIMVEATWTIIDYLQYDFKGDTLSSSLPTTGNTVDDLYFLTDTNNYVYWNGSIWTVLGAAGYFDTQYQVFYLTFEIIGATYTGGVHALAPAYLVSGTYDNIQPALYTVQDGINNFENLDIDYYEQISAIFDSLFGDLNERVTDLEDGTTPAGKAIADQNGDVIDTTYEKVARKVNDASVDSADNYLSQKVGYNIVNGVEQFTKIRVKDPLNPTFYVDITYKHTNGNNYQVTEYTYPDGRVVQANEQLDGNYVNKTGDTLNSGIVLMTDGVTVGNQAINGIYFDEDSTNSIKVAGVVTVDGVANNAKSKVTRLGIVSGIDESDLYPSGTAYAEGQFVYARQGKLSNVAPNKPSRIVGMGIIINKVSTKYDVLVVEPIIRFYMGELNDVDIPSPVEGIIPRYGSASKYEGYNIDTALDNQKFTKTGWPLNISSLITTSFDDGTRTLTLSKVSADVDYYIQNVKYTLSTDKTVVIDDTEGLWFIYLVGETLTASQTAWDILAADKCFVATVYWDATNNMCMACSFEGHSYEMDSATHYNNHNAIGAYVINGLVASDNGANGLDVTAGKIGDEDIVCQVVDDDTPTAMFEQPLTPLKGHKYYRTGASGLLRKVDDSTIPVYLLSNVVQLNPYSGGTYSLVPMTLNKYGAYWVVLTTDFNEPVKMFLGQAESDSLNNAIEDNGLLSMNFGQLPLPEIKVAYRYIVQQLAIAPYYSIEQVDSFVVDPSLGAPSDPATSHGALSGLGDDDHTQYYNATRIAAYKTATLDTDFVKQSLPYTQITEADLVGTEKLFINKATAKYINAQDLKDWIIATSGTFDPTADYSSQGLGAYIAKNLKQLVLTGSTGQYGLNIVDGVNLMDIEDNVLMLVKFPDTSADSTLTTQLSFNATDYRYLQSNGGNIPVSSLSEKVLLIYRDGTVLKVLGDIGFNYPITHSSLIESTYGVINPTDNGIPSLTELKGLSIYQALIDGDDFATSWTLSNATGSVSSGVYSFTPTAQFGGLRQNQTFIDTNLYFAIAKVKTTDSNLRLIANNASISGNNIHTGSGNYETLTALITATATTTRISVETFSSSGFVQVDVDYVMLIPISNTVWSSLTASQISSRIGPYWEGFKDIVNPTIKTVGKNLFDEKWELGTIDTNGQETPSTTLIRYVNYMAVKSLTSYYFYNNNISILNIAVFEYDANYNFIKVSFGSGATNNITVITQSNTRYVRARTVSTNIQEEHQLEEGTTATTYEAYRSKTLTLNGTFRSAGTVQDLAKPINGIWNKVANVGYAEGIAIGATINTTTLPLISTSGVFEAYDSVNNEYQYGSYGDTLTLTGTATVRYELATPTETEIEYDGSLIQDTTTTIIQSGLATDITVTYPLNNEAQLPIVLDRLLEIQREIDVNEVAIAQNATDIAAIETKTNNITVTQAVDLDTMESDIANVKGKTDNITVTGVINLDNVKEQVSLDTAINVSSATSIPAANITLSEAYTNYTHLEIDFYRSGKYFTRKLPVNGFASGGAQYIAVRYDINTVNEDQLSFRIERITDTTFAAYYGYFSTLTYAGPTYSGGVDSSIYILDIRGIK